MVSTRRRQTDPHREPSRGEPHARVQHQRRSVLYRLERLIRKLQSPSLSSAISELRLPLPVAVRAPTLLRRLHRPLLRVCASPAFPRNRGAHHLQPSRPRAVAAPEPVRAVHVGRLLRRLLQGAGLRGRDT